jgi:hypothetical protein
VADASELLRRLVAIGEREKLRRIVGYASAENAAMLRVARAAASARAARPRTTPSSTPGSTCHSPGNQPARPPARPRPRCARSRLTEVPRAS